ncbi:MAG: ABC transporter permease subunit [Bacillota bacterium]|jgi:ABC-2 type transport system permease protein
MSIFRKDLLDNLRTSLIWTVSLVAFCVWMMSLFSSFADAGEILGFVEQFPESFRKAFGVDRLNMATVDGFFGTEIHLMILLFGSIFAALLGSGILSKEENGRTIEFLLSKPVSRRRVLTSKVLVYTTLLLAFNAFIWTASYAAMNSHDTSFDERAFWILGGMTVGAHLTFANLGFLGSVFVTRSRSVYAGSLGFVLFMYALQLVADTSENLKFLGHLSPIKWASGPDILSKGAVVPGYLTALLAVNLAALAMACVLYQRKDILT